MEPFGDTVIVVAVPVGYQDGFAVGGFDEVFQSIQLAVMQVEDFFLFAVNGTVCHLAQFIVQGRGIGGINLLTAQGNHHVMLHGVVQRPLLFGEGDLDLIHDALWHLEVVCSFHGDGDVGDFLMDGILCTGEGLVGEHHLSVTLVRLEVGVAVMGDESSQPLPHVQETELRPKVHETVAGGSAGQPNDALDRGANLEERSEPLCLVAFEGGQLIDDHHVVVKGDVAVLDEPLDILTVDDVHEGSLLEGGFSFCLAAHCHGIA